jgi:sigma-B regulation protein RsbU (phosphoserine phosphatase)
MLRLGSLQQRLSLFMFLPVALLLIAMGFVGFIYARDSLVNQWREAAILKLQRAAHQVDMRLSHTKAWIGMFHKTAGETYPDLIHLWVVEQLEGIEGIERVNLIWNDHTHDQGLQSGSYSSMGLLRREAQGLNDSSRMQMRHFHSARITEITPPRYDASAERETVSLLSNLNDESGQTIGRLEVLLNFDYLIENIAASGWWQSHKAFLVDNTGKILISTADETRRKLGDNNDPLEQNTLAALLNMPFGTILGQGHPPSEVIGFYKLHEAPWTLVMIAPGEEILAPIIRFRLYYTISGAIFILVVLFLIRSVMGRTVTAIKDVSKAADKVARGDYGELLPVKTQDEVGELTRSFNSMVCQLKERIQMKEALDLAMEVQQNLLPQQTLKLGNLDIAGRSIYCDETGGDYYDFLTFSRRGQKRMGVAVGDVVGHGISAALLMTTVRALLRSRISQPGSLSEIIDDVNRLLCKDTSQSGSFMSLFFMMIDTVAKEIQWVRAGHDPAIIYEPATDSFDELGGEGIVLGVDAQWSYQDNRHSGLNGGQIILIGTDGIWETENPAAQKFGKDRLRQTIRQHRNGSAEEILQAITDALAAFRQTASQDDDITLVAIKVTQPLSTVSVG